MYSYLRYVIIMTLLTVTSSDVHGQKFNFKQLGEDQGFPSSAIYHLMQDKNGYLWLSSSGGLIRYDGRKPIVYDNSKGTTDNIIFSSYEGKDGKVFYTSANCKLGYIYQNKTYTPACSDSLASILQGRFFINAMVDRKNDSLLMATQKGFFTLNINNASSIKRIASPPGVSFWVRTENDRAIGAFYAEAKVTNAKDHNIYMLRVELAADFVEIPVRLEVPSPGPSIFKCTIQRDGTVLVGFYNQIIVITKDKKWSVKSLKSRLNNVYADPNGKVWIAYYNGGIECYSGQLKELIHSELESSSVTSVLIDQEGGLWAGTQDNGIFHCPFTDLFNYSNILSNYQDVRFAYIPSRVYAFTKNSKVLMFQSRKVIDSVLLPDFVNYKEFVRFYRSKDVIYGGGRNHPFMCDTNLRNVKKLKIRKGETAPLIYDFSKHPSGDLFALSHDGVWKIKQDSLILLQKFTIRARSLYVDKNGSIFIGSSDGLYVSENNTLHKVDSVNSSVLDITEDPGGDFWLSTEADGLIKMRREEIVEKLNRKMGLPVDQVFLLHFDSYGNKWLGTQKGLCRIDAGGRVDVFNKSDGFKSNTQYGAVQCGTDLYVISGKEMYVCELNKFRSNSKKPLLYLDSIKVNGAVTEQHSFHYKDRNYQFYFNALLLSDPEDIRFEYRLLGYDTSSYHNRSGEISFSNLSEGNYTLSVQAISRNGAKSAAFTYPFIIQTPFWKSAWFILLSIVFTFLLTFYFIRRRIFIIKKQEEQKTQINKMIAEYQMTALQSQMNPHFIFNAINSIQNYILNHKSQDAYDYLAAFSKLIRQVLVNSQQIMISLNKELELLQLYLDLEQRRFKRKFDYQIQVDDKINTDELLIPSLTIQPYVENAIWHGIMSLGSDKTGKIDIHVKLENENLIIEITDNGVGRVAAAQGKSDDGKGSLGLELSEKRISILKKLTGEEATITIEDLYVMERSAGTRVRIIIPSQIQ